MWKKEDFSSYPKYFLGTGNPSWYHEFSCTNVAFEVLETTRLQDLTLAKIQEDDGVIRHVALLDGGEEWSHGFSCHGAEITPEFYDEQAHS